MEKAVNKVILTGFAGGDAEVRNVSGNQRVAKVSLAVIEGFRNSGDDLRKTQWFNLTFWNARADIAEAKIKKGVRFSIEGRLQTGSYEAKDGTKRYTTEIVVSEIAFDEERVAS